jgi:hypothetical protein
MKNVKLLPVNCLLLLSGLMLGTACESEQAPIRLTSSERVRIDTLVKREVDSLAPLLDSICEAEYEGMVERAVDSIVRLRRAEERKLRERLKQKE